MTKVFCNTKVFFSKKRLTKIGFAFLILPIVLSAQLNYSGSAQPAGMFRSSDGSKISLPFRMAELKLGYTLGNFDIKTSSSLEYRWSTGETEFDLREAYAVWYPRFGEVKVGKQIHAWGAADGNNPTDNLNAYDYYYMFLPGTDRKIGSLSAAVSAYLGAWRIEAVVIPEHVPNRYTFGEEDFPIKPPFEPGEYIKVEDPLEYGARLQTTVGESDFSVSYFEGHDRGFSLIGMNYLQLQSVNMVLPLPQFGYRSTSVLGGDFVTFFGDLTLRGEMGFFMTENEANDCCDALLPLEAEYLQYVLQGEVTGPFDIQFSGQFIGSTVLKAEGLTFNQVILQQTELTKDSFVPGMGTPFAMFAKQAIMLSGTGNLMDNSLELRATTLVNLEEAGMMGGFGVAYSPLENWEVELGLTQFFGDEADPTNPFTQLEDFSHMSVGFKYSF